MKTLILALLCGVASAQVPLAANMVSITDGSTSCSEASGCVVTAVSLPAQFQFGIGTTWAPLTAITLPSTVQYSNAHPPLEPYDPAPGVLKVLEAQQGSASYTVTWKDSAGKVHVSTIAALGKTAVKSWSCTTTVVFTLYSDSTISTTGPVGCTVVAQ